MNDNALVVESSEQYGLLGSKLTRIAEEAIQTKKDAVDKQYKLELQKAEENGDLVVGLLPGKIEELAEKGLRHIYLDFFQNALSGYGWGKSDKPFCCMADLTPEFCKMSFMGASRKIALWALSENFNVGMMHIGKQAYEERYYLLSGQGALSEKTVKNNCVKVLLFLARSEMYVDLFFSFS